MFFFPFPPKARVFVCRLPAKYRPQVLPMLVRRRTIFCTMLNKNVYTGWLVLVHQARPYPKAVWGGGGLL